MRHKYKAGCGVRNIFKVRCGIKIQRRDLDMTYFESGVGPATCRILNESQNLKIQEGKTLIGNRLNRISSEVTGGIGMKILVGTGWRDWIKNSLSWMRD